MAKTTKRVVVGSMVAAGIVGLMAIIDLFTGVPFSRKIMMDILFLISAAVVIYMGYDTMQDLS